MPATLRVCTVNVRVNASGDGDDAWPNRRSLLVDTVRAIDPDVIGLQEPRPEQYEYLRANLDGLDWYGVDRQGDGSGEFVPVGWRADRFTAADRETRWLSTTPDRPGSVGWDAAFPRILTSVRLHDAVTERPFVLHNTHLDHEGTTARVESARRIAERVARDDDPAIVIGDFNATPGSEPLRMLTDPGIADDDLRDARRVARTTNGPAGTFHEFTGRPMTRIDYVFVPPTFTVQRHETVTTCRDGRYPSDHFPVVTDLRFDPE